MKNKSNMKKLAILLTFIFIIGCNAKQEELYKIKYVVYYTPTQTDTLENLDHYKYIWGCSRDGNYIYKVGVGYIYQGTAPFKILSYTINK